MRLIPAHARTCSRAEGCGRRGAPCTATHYDGGDVKILLSYLRNYRGLIALALALAAINQVFSLLDPLIFRYVIDEYATRFQEYTTA